MFHFIIRGISMVTAAAYTLLVIGISYFSAIPEYSTENTLEPAADIDVKINQITNVSVLQNREEISLEFQQAVDLYTAEMPESIRFSVQTISSEPDYHSALRAKLISGDGPDLFMISSARESIELRKYLCDLSFLPWISNAYPITLDAVTSDGKIYGIPYSVEGLGLICNREIFEDAEISLTDIQSFESLSEAFDKLKIKIEEKSLNENYMDLEAVCELAAHDKSFLSGGLLDIALTDAFKTPLGAAQATEVSFPAAVQIEDFIKLMAKLSSNRSDWSKLTEITEMHQIERFANGRTAVIIGDTNVYKLINEINPKMQGKAFLLPIPLDTFEQPCIYAGAPVYWAINSESGQAEKTASGEFITWLYRSDEGTEFFAENFNAVSAYSDTGKPTGVALHSQMLGYLKTDMILPRFSGEAPKNWSKDVFAVNVQSYFTLKEKTWDEVIQACIDGWNQKIN